MPALHISLGIYLKFYNLLEASSQIVDLKILAKTTEGDEKSIMDTYNIIQDLEDKIMDNEKTIELIEEAMAIELTKAENDEDRVQTILDVYKPRIDHFNGKIVEKVKDYYLIKNTELLYK